VVIENLFWTNLIKHFYHAQWLATGRWFSPGPPVSSTNKTDRNDITEILLKVALNNGTTKYQSSCMVQPNTRTLLWYNQIPELSHGTTKYQNSCMVQPNTRTLAWYNQILEPCYGTTKYQNTVMVYWTFTNG
jgi:hypothetical protein